MSKLAAGGFNDTTRLAGTEANVAFDIAITNRTQIVHWLERYREALADLQERLSDEEGEDLFRHMAQASWDYTTFREGAVGREEVDQKTSEIPKTDMANLFMGEALASKMREMTAASEERLRDLDREDRLTRRE
jgi:hypothetical protein